MLRKRASQHRERWDKRLDKLLTETGTFCCVPLQPVLEKVRRRDPDQKEFLQACEEVLTSLEPALEKYPHLADVLERMTEPERQIIFRYAHMKPFSA